MLLLRRAAMGRRVLNTENVVEIHERPSPLKIV